MRSRFAPGSALLASVILGACSAAVCVLLATQRPWLGVTLAGDATLPAGPVTITGKISPKVGFPAHIYTASKDGMVRIIMETSNVNPRDNGGIAYRPYMRALSISNAERNGEAWSTNGYRNGATASGEIVFRVKKGEKFTVVATLGQHLEAGARVNANYTLTVKE